jgi:hypothetical protein
MKERVKNGWNVYFDERKVLVKVDRLVIPFPGCGRIDGHEITDPERNVPSSIQTYARVAR